MLFIHFVFLFIWDGGHCLKIFLFIENKKVDITHRLLYWTQTGRQNAETATLH